MGIFNGQHAKANGNSTTTLIAKDCSINGKFDIEGCLHVDGRVSGNIKCIGTVIIGQSGHIDGEIDSGKLLVSGAFEGQCRAEMIQVLEGGNLKGTIYSDQLIIEPGGHFFGDSHSLSDKKAGLELVHTQVMAQEK